MKTLLVAGSLLLFSACVSPPKPAATKPADIFANLGDGLRTDHFFPIVDFLEIDSPSLKRRNALEADLKTPRTSNSKAGINKYTSSEFSSLIRAIAKANDLESAAVYDIFGFAIGYYDKNNILPLFIDIEEVEQIMKFSLESSDIRWDQIDEEMYRAYRVIQKPGGKEPLGISAVVVSTEKFVILD